MTTDDIKLPPIPNPDTRCFDEDHATDVWSHSQAQMQDYAREAVRLNAQAVPEISTGHGPWIESTLHEGETYCKRCLVRSVFADRKKCEPHIVSPAQAPQQKGANNG